MIRLTCSTLCVDGATRQARALTIVAGGIRQAVDLVATDAERLHRSKGTTLPPVWNELMRPGGVVRKNQIEEAE